MFRIVIAISLVLFVLVGLAALRRLSKAAAPASAAGVCCPRCRCLTRTIALVCVVALALTGFVAVLAHVPLSGWWLLLHVAVGGLFALVATLALVMDARQHGLAALGAGVPSSTNLSEQICFWLCAAAAAVLIATPAVAMLPLFGTKGQHWLIEAHRAAGLVGLWAITVYAVAWLRRRN